MMNWRCLKHLCTVCVVAGTLFCSATDAHDFDHPDDDDSPSLLDANGHLVGKLFLSTESAPEGAVLIDVEGIPVLAGVRHLLAANGSTSATELQWWAFGPNYSGSHCTGDVLLSPWVNSGPFRPNAILRNGVTATLYVASDQPTKRVTENSLIDVDGKCIEESPAEWDDFAVGATVDLTARYPEPLRIAP